MDLELPFSHSDYAKLRCRMFTTLRKNPKREYGEPGETVNVSVKNGEDFEATLLAKRDTTLKALSDQLLIFDTVPIDELEWTRENAIERIQGFYRDKIRETEKFTLYIYFKG